MPRRSDGDSASSGRCGNRHRRVEVEQDGQWWPGFQSRWLLCDDGRGWVAQVEYGVRHEHGVGKHLACVPPERLRPADC